MEQFKLGEMEQKFADIIWECQPISSGELVKICETKLSWKKSTTYTMLKRLCQRNIFENKNGVVISLMSKEDFSVSQGEEFLNESFSGSLPMFLTAFTKRKKISEKEMLEIKKLIDEYQED